jgi:regulator of ribonuclease activity A
VVTRTSRLDVVHSTADLLDAHGEQAAVCLTPLRSFGTPRFSGPVATVRCFEDNVLLRGRVSEPGRGRVLVVDGGGSLRCALLGDNIARLAKDSGWAGIVVNGCVRDVVALGVLGLGIKALGSNPRPSGKTGGGEIDVPVSFGEIEFAPGALLTSDEDGIVVLPMQGSAAADVSAV